MSRSLLKLLEKYWWMAATLAGVITYTIIMILSAGQSIWFDEGYSILLAKKSFGELMALTAVDAHPPFYYLLLKLWGGVFGFGEFALRSLSAILMGGAVAAMLALIKKAFGSRAALVAVPFLILAPFVLRYGYEVRMYALATMLGVAATYVLVQAVSSKTAKWWVFYAVLVALGMYTLYMTVAIWLAHLVWLLVTNWKSIRKTPIWNHKWALSYAGAVLLFAPYIPTFLHQLSNSALPGIGNQVTITEIGNIISTSLLYTPEWGMNGWLTLLLLAALILFGVVITKVWRSTKNDQPKIYQLIIMMVVVPLLFFALSSLPPREPIFIIRYIAHMSIYIYALIGISIGLELLAYKKRLRLLPIATGTVMLFVVVVGTFNLGSAGNFNFERMQQPMTRELRQLVTCDNDTTIIADDPYTYIDSFFYYDNCDLRFYFDGQLANAGGYAPIRDSKSQIRSSEEISAKTLVHLRWKGSNPSFAPDARYRQVASANYDKQVVDTYELSAE